MRERVVRRKRGSRVVRYLSLAVFLLAAWVLSANSVLRPYLSPPVRTAQIAAPAENAGEAAGDAGTLASGPTVLPMLTASALPQLAAANQPATTEPVARSAAGTLPTPTEETNSPVLTSPFQSPVRLASAAPTVGGADISDATVIAKAVEPAMTAPAAVATPPVPRKRPRIAAIPLPRPRPGYAYAAPASFFGRLFGVR